MPSTAKSKRLLLLLAVAVVSLALALAVVLLASAFVLASLARRLRSASLLPLSTRPGFLGFVFGGSAVTRAGVGVGSSGIVSSGCDAMVSIFRCSEFYKVPVRFLSDFCKCFTLHQYLRVDNPPCLCWDVALLLSLCCAVQSSRAQVPPQVARFWL